MSNKIFVRVACPLCGAERSKPERCVNGFALERCTACQFVFVNPRYPVDAVLGQYEHENAARQVDLWARITNPFVLADYDRVLDQLGRLLPGKGRLLDFGCGPCYFLERAVRRGWDARGVELAAWAREAAKVRGVSDRLYSGLLQDQNLPDASFDVIYSNQVFEHLDQPRADLRELNRLLRPGGILYLNVPNYHRIPVLFNRDDFALDMPMAHLNYFTPRSLARLVRTEGFQVVRVNTYGGLKLENLLGRPTRSDILEAVTAHESGADAPPVWEKRPPLLKRFVAPVVRLLAYRLAKWGMTLELFAHKP